jgi:hypothetical protein
MKDNLEVLSDSRGASPEDLRALEEHLKEVQSIMERLGLETLLLGNNNDIPKKVTVYVKKGT